VRTTRLRILQVLQKHLSLGVVGRKLQNAFQLRAREIGLLLIQINFCQHRANERRVSRLKRRLQFFHRVGQISTPPGNFRNPPMGRGICRIAGERGAKLRFSGVQPTNRKFLPPTANARCRSFLNNSAGRRNAARRSRRLRRHARRHNFKPQWSDIKLRLNPLWVRHSVCLGRLRP